MKLSKIGIIGAGQVGIGTTQVCLIKSGMEFYVYPEEKPVSRSFR